MDARQPVELPSHDALALLAREDPQAYEALRREVIESFIDSAPAGMRARLRGIQFRVDCVRQSSRSALGSTVKVYQQMWESFLNLDDAWQNLVRVQAGQADTHDPGPATACAPVRNAQLFEFRQRSPCGQACAPLPSGFQGAP